MSRKNFNQETSPPQKGWPRVAIIVLNWNRWRDTLACLESLRRITYLDYQITVVDNGSRDGSVEKIQPWARENLGLPALRAVEQPNPRLFAADGRLKQAAPACSLTREEFPGSHPLTLLAVNQNLGFSGGNNVAIEFALRDPQVEHVFLLNNDAWPEPACITTCVEVAREADAAVVGALVKSHNGDRILFTGGHHLLLLFQPLLNFAVARYAERCRRRSPSGRYWAADWVCGAGMLIRRDLLLECKQAFGYFLDPTLFIYSEDVEFCVRARRGGHRVVLAAEAVVRHPPGLATSSGGPGNPLAYYYSTRNCILLAKMLLPGGVKLLFHLYYASSRLLRALHRAVQRKPEVSVAILQGLVDGYRGTGGRWKNHHS